MKPYWKQIGLGAGEQYRRFERLREAAVACGQQPRRASWGVCSDWFTCPLPRSALAALTAPTIACPPSCTWTCSPVTFCCPALPFDFCMTSICSLNTRIRRVARSTLASLPSMVWSCRVARLRNRRAASCAAIICTESMASVGGRRGRIPTSLNAITVTKNSDKSETEKSRLSARGESAASNAPHRAADVRRQDDAKRIEN